MQQRDDERIYEFSTTIGEFTAEQVVIATGGYHRPKIPALRERFAPEMQQIHSSQYKNPESLPDKPILAISTGQSGCQIAADSEARNQSSSDSK